MTREHKLALILGFALVLVVGVLVSDHISGSQRSVASTQSMDDPVRAIETELGPGLGQASKQPHDRLLPGLPLSDQQTEQIATDEPKPSTVIDDLIGAVGDRVNNIRDTPPPVAGQTDRADRSEPGVIRMGDPPVSRPLDHSGGGDRGSEVRFHRVEDRQTLWGIAERYYGDGNLHTKLAAWNTDLVGSGGSIRPGVSLVIPSRSLLDSGITNAGDAPVAEKPSPQTQTWVYVVKRGDVLGTISQRELGTTKRVPEIMELNRDTISSPDEIWIGLELRMPPR